VIDGPSPGSRNPVFPGNFKIPLLRYGPEVLLTTSRFP
jgi:hypothetical protein